MTAWGTGHGNRTQHILTTFTLDNTEVVCFFSQWRSHFNCV